MEAYVINKNVICFNNGIMMRNQISCFNMPYRSHTQVHKFLWYLFPSIYLLWVIILPPFESSLFSFRRKFYNAGKYLSCIFLRSLLRLQIILGLLKSHQRKHSNLPKSVIVNSFLSNFRSLEHLYCKWQFQKLV